MQIATPLPRQTLGRSMTVVARLGSLVLGIALLTLGAGTAWAVAAGPADTGFDRSAPAISQTLGSAPLTLPNGAPGDTVVSHTTIAYDGAEAGTVRLYGEVAGDLAPNLAVTIVRDTGAHAWQPVFEGTLAELPSGWTSGLSNGRAWLPGERHTYRITVTLLDHPAAQGGSAEATFRWETRPAGA